MSVEREAKRACGLGKREEMEMGKRGLRRFPNVHAARACNARARVSVRSVDGVNGWWMSHAPLSHGGFPSRQPIFSTGQTQEGRDGVGEWLPRFLSFPCHPRGGETILATPEQHGGVSGGVGLRGGRGWEGESGVANRFSRSGDHSMSCEAEGSGRPRANRALRRQWRLPQEAIPAGRLTFRSELTIREM